MSMDKKWWQVTKPEFAGERLTLGEIEEAKRVKLPSIARNSGAAAILLAHSRDADKVVLLGYDCQVTGGKKHWHGDHVKPLGNAGSMSKWPHQFFEVANHIGDLTVVNCTRQTALKIWPLRELEGELC